MSAGGFTIQEDSKCALFTIHNSHTHEHIANQGQVWKLGTRLLNFPLMPSLPLLSLPLALLHPLRYHRTSPPTSTSLASPLCQPSQPLQRKRRRDRRQFPTLSNIFTIGCSINSGPSPTARQITQSSANELWANFVCLCGQRGGQMHHARNNGARQSRGMSLRQWVGPCTWAPAG